MPKTKTRTPTVRAAEQLGHRIREARTEMGLSLSALAGEDFSRAFINQIELGKASPSMRTLQVLSQRLQRPIEYFLQSPDLSSAALELALTEAQTKIQRGQFAEARDLMTKLMERNGIPLEVRVKAQANLAEALLRLGSPAEAVSLIEDSLRVAESRHWISLQVELCDRMGRAHYLLRHASEAGRWFDRALALYERETLVDPLLKARIIGHQANLLYLDGHASEAVAGYERAIAAAAGVLDTQAMAGIYEGLAVSLQRAGQYDRALGYAQQSLRLWERLGDARMSAQLRNNMADILLGQGRASEAEQLFAEGAAQLRGVGDTQLLPYLAAGAAEAALEQGHVNRAQRLIEDARLAVKASADPLASVAVERTSGRVAFAVGSIEESRQHFETAIALATTAEDMPARSRAMYDYARMLEESGHHREAALQYRQAYDLRRLDAS